MIAKCRWSIRLAKGPHVAGLALIREAAEMLPWLGGREPRE
jgi:hypothetical protein